MPKISQKGVSMPASPIRKLVPYADKAKAQGKHIFHLNIGQPDIKTPKVAIDAVKNIDLEIIEYSHSAGNETYRRKLASYYKKNGIDVSFEELMITTGGSEALSFSLLSCLDPGDEVIIPEPFYANYNGFALAGNIQIKPITTSIDTGFALPPIQAFEEVITHKTKAILICNPNNPTGYLYAKEELDILAEIVKKHDLFLFADEVYREFAYDGKTHTSILNLPGLDEHAIVVDSISKRFSACGARIGALVTRNQDILKSAMKFAQARLSPPSLGQIVGEAALDAEANYIPDVITEYVSRRNVMVDCLNKIDGVICPTPGGAFYAMVQLPVDDTEIFCQWLLEDFDHNGKTLMIAPGSGFYSNKELGKQQARIAYVLNKDDLKEAMDCLEEALKVYPERV